MASLISGYNYDIFISYRQKDNKHDGWVTEFVNQLKGELEATFKEDISIYFDENPHDGLLETHSVDKSLEDKLKCLIFIPIISQTYCDSKSFAWQHEFCAFNRLAKEDQFGRDIKLTSGNVASRILPVKIHDLDPEDKTLLENELGGFIRGIEFIYKEPGVNRPLKPEDDEKKNLNNTIYRNQINKVANAVKEIIGALKKQSQHSEESPKQDIEAKNEPQKNLRTIIITGILILLALIVLGYFIIPKLFKSSEPVEKTIAVLPFRNLSNDTTQLYFCDGFMEEILNDLQKVNSFTVRSRTSSDQYRDTKKSIATIGNELNVNYLVEGSIGHEGNNLKIWVQLIDSKADKHLWSNDYTREMKQIFSLQSEIAKEIASELKAVLSPEEIEKIEKRPTENLEAYNYYLQGNYYNTRSAWLDWKTAIKLYEKAIELDPGFALAYIGIAECFRNQYWFYQDRSEDMLRKCKQAIDKSFEIYPDLPAAHLALGWYYYQGHLEYSKALEQAEIVLKEQPGNTEAPFLSAAVYRRLGSWEMAKTNFLKAFELNPRSSINAYDLAETYSVLREYSEAQQYFNMAIMIQPNWSAPYVGLSWIFLKREGNTTKAREILEKEARNIKSLMSDSSIIETNINLDIYDGKYEEALKILALFKSKVFQGQNSFTPKYLYYANIYGLMNKPELEYAYYDSACIFLEKKMIDLPEDPRLYSALGVAYAGMGLNEKAINISEKAVKLLPVSKEVTSA
ncbi:MAG: hypothetical protein NTZ85_10405 [Bacteroidia bacterium]|nr:hypothetical protein [Bacteroidia bacterium]